MFEYLKFFLLFNNLILIMSEVKLETDELNTKVVSTQNYMIWENATVPFYITPHHFDEEQTLTIMRALSLFAFKTCLKFVPVLDTPTEDSHVMTFINPDGIKRCTFDTSGHSALKAHNVHLGYDCLKSPNIDMMIMRSLGFPFEHNRMSRDLYINVRFENIEPGAAELFTKDIALPTELRVLPYDINSVMHFDQREYSKNGHRTIVFKNPNLQQNRVGLTQNDLKKITIVYQDECHKRDRQEKIEICQSYPGIVRKKREVESPGNSKSLRVNPNITPPAAVGEKTENVEELEPEKKQQIAALSSTVAKLGIEKETQAIVDSVHKATRQALKVAREKYCNITSNEPLVLNKTELNPGADIINIVEIVAAYTSNIVETAISNLTEFCESTDESEALRYFVPPCSWQDPSKCRQSYRSTKSGRVFYSTKHYPVIYQSTKHKGKGHHYSYDKMMAYRSGTGNDSETTTEQLRRKREIPQAKDLSEKENANNSKSDKDALPKRRFFERHGGNKDTSNSDWAASALSEEKESETPSEASETGTVDDDVTPRSLPSNIKLRETVDFGDKEMMKAQEDDSGESDMETTTIKHYKSKSKEKLKIRDIVHKTLEKKKLKKMQAIPATINMTKMNREFYNERRWPEGVVRYVISPVDEYDLSDMRERLGAVSRVLKKKTCVTLEEVTEEEAVNHEDYLVIDTSPDYVTGRVGGRQHFGSIELFKGGQHKQHAAMMVMAMLGFYFEVARHDRDKHIRVHMRHVRPDKLHHFEKIREEATLDVPYDYSSAMHPAWQFWRKIGKTGISTVATFKDKDPDGSIMRSLGQHDQLFSDADIMKINTVYGIECFTETDERRSAVTKSGF